MIHVGGSWWLDCDPNCFILSEKYINEKGNEAWRNQTYHSTHEQVIKEIANIAIKEAITHDVKAMVEITEGFKQKFREFKEFKR